MIVITKPFSTKMRNKIVILTALALVALVILSSLSVTSLANVPHTSSTDSSGISTYTNLVENRQILINGGISITGDSGFSSSVYVSAGNGTKENPYVIQNLDIAVNNDTGIYISDTSSYFLIKDVVINMKPISSGFENGINLQDVSNGQFANVTIFSNLYPTTYIVNGTYLSNESLSGLTMYNSNNISISGSLMKNLTGGIGIYESSNISVSNTNISYAVINGIGSEFSENLHFSDNQISHNHHNNMQIINSQEVKVERNHLSYAGGDNVWLWNTSNSYILFNNVSYDLKYQAILVYPGNHDTVANNTVFSSAQAIVLFPGNNSTVVNNQIYNVSDGIVIGGSVNDSISSNHIADSKNLSIELGWGSRDLTVEGNQIQDSGTGVDVSSVTGLTLSSNEICMLL